MPGQLECAVRRSDGCAKHARYVCHHCGKPLCGFEGKGTTPKEKAATGCLISHADEEFPDGTGGYAVAHHCPDCDHGAARRTRRTAAPAGTRIIDRPAAVQGGSTKWLVLAAIVIAIMAGTGWWLSPTGVSGTGAGSGEYVVAALIGEWASALRSRDLDRHVGYYAPRLDDYFGRRGVDRSVVANEKRRQLDTRFRQLNAYEVSISGMTWTSSTEVVVRVRKRWDARRANGTRDTGDASHQLTIRRTGDQWRIVAERE